MNNDKNLKFLSVNNALGFLTNKPTEILLPELCAKIYEICLNFKAEMLDEIYSDGPVFFKSYIKDGTNNNELIIFTSIGNKLNPKEENLKHLIFEPHLLIKSYDFDSLRPNQLKEYYDDLLQKYRKVYNSNEVYHALYVIGDEVFVDVYSEVN